MIKLAIGIFCMIFALLACAAIIWSAHLSTLEAEAANDKQQDS